MSGYIANHPDHGMSRKSPTGVNYFIRLVQNKPAALERHSDSGKVTMMFGNKYSVGKLVWIDDNPIGCRLQTAIGWFQKQKKSSGELSREKKAAIRRAIKNGDKRATVRRVFNINESTLKEVLRGGQ